MAELLLELFSEEIPARMQARAAQDLSKLLTDGLKAADLGFDKVEALVTPRRLTLIVDGLPEKQPDLREERRGPRADAPEKAINGFLAGNGVTLDQCEKRETPKGVFLFAIVEQKGRAASEVINDIIEDAMNKLPWPKSMRWADQKIRWVRQLDRILCLFDGKVIPVTYGPVTAGDTTRGHRFLAPAEFSVANAADYKEKLRAAKVMLDREERKQVILEGAKKLAASEGFALLEDNGLLEEVCGLVEWPVPVMGKVDDQFMDIPREVLETSMREHQKYFVVEDKAGKLAARFITVSNMVTADKNAKIIAGNERVLRARLHDAKFFWDQDRKVTLQSRLPKLDNIVFHAKLGSLAERVMRLRGLARELSADIPNCDVKLADRAAEIGKADLVSQMVFEFTELQGLMGKYYAENDGEAPEVATPLPSITHRPVRRTCARQRRFRLRWLWLRSLIPLPGSLRLMKSRPVQKIRLLCVVQHWVSFVWFWKTACVCRLGVSLPLRFPSTRQIFVVTRLSKTFWPSLLTVSKSICVNRVSAMIWCRPCLPWMARTILSACWPVLKRFPILSLAKAAST